MMIRRYAAWLDRWRWVVLAASLAVAVGAGALAAQLPIYGDFSYLLPPSAPSVQQLRRLEKRVTNLGTIIVLVEADDPAARARAANDMVARLTTVDPGLV